MKTAICFCVPGTGNRYYSNTAVNIGNCMGILHPEQHVICSVSCELFNNIKES